FILRRQRSPSRGAANERTHDVGLYRRRDGVANRCRAARFRGSATDRRLAVGCPIWKDGTWYRWPKFWSHAWHRWPDQQPRPSAFGRRHADCEWSAAGDVVRVVAGTSRFDFAPE